MRHLRVERQRVAGTQFELLEADPDAQPAADDVRVFLASVPRERVLGARRSADVVDDVEELELVVRFRGQQLPADPVREPDRLACVVALNGTARGRGGGTPGPSRRRGDVRFAEQVVDQQAQLVRDRVQRAHRRHHAAPLDLRHETRRNADGAGHAPHRRPGSLARAPQPRAQAVRGVA